MIGCQQVVAVLTSWKSAGQHLEQQAHEMQVQPTLGERKSSDALESAAFCWLQDKVCLQPGEEERTAFLGLLQQDGCLSVDTCGLFGFHVMLQFRQKAAPYFYLQECQLLLWDGSDFSLWPAESSWEHLALFSALERLLQRRLLMRGHSRASAPRWALWIGTGGPWDQERRTLPDVGHFTASQTPTCAVWVQHLCWLTGKDGSGDEAFACLWNFTMTDFYSKLLRKSDTGTFLLLDQFYDLWTRRRLKVSASARVEVI